ncbi:MAG TPA: histidine kinase [Chitinophagaceae bacterium]
MKSLNKCKHIIKTSLIYSAFIAMVITWPLVTAAQLPNYQLNRIQEEEGLRTSDVINLARDKKGFMWMASQSYVQQFDGRHTLQFSFNESVNRIVIDAKDRKWVLTRGSIFLFVGNYEGFREIPLENNIDLTVVYLYETGGAIYALGGGRHFIFNESLQKFQFAESLIKDTAIRVTRYFGKADNFLFFGNGNSVFRFDQQSKKTISIFIGNINNVIPLTAKDLLVSTALFKTYYVNLEKSEKILIGTGKNKEPAFGNNLVLYSGLKQKDDRYLISSNKGLFHFNTGTQSVNRPVFYYNGRLLENQQSTTFLYSDGRGSIYMNHADGIFFMNNSADFIQYFRNYSYANEKMPSNDVRNFSEDAGGNIWMATTNGILRLNIETGELNTFDPLKRKNIIDIPSYRQLLDDNTYLWIGTSGNGVYRYHKRAGSYERPVFAATEEGKKEAEAFNILYVWEMLKMSDGKILVVGGARLFIIDPVSLLTKQVRVAVSPAVSRSAIQDLSGRIWHGTTSGLFCYDTAFNLLFRLRDSLPDKRVASFCEWKKNKMLIGSKGLFEVEVSDHKIVSFKQKKSIPAGLLIYCMKQDKQGFVWLGTNDGIYRYDPEKDESIMFDRSDHVQSQAFNSDAAFISSKGLLFMGGKNGVNYFDPSTFVRQPQSLDPRILAFAVNIGDSTQYGAGQHIPYSSRNIDFIISAPEYKKPFRLQYRYRLSNDEKLWTYTGFNNHVRISKLQPGKYSLQASASYDGNEWFDSNDLVPFTILKPWWQTWWFRLLCVAAIAFAVWRFAKYRRKKREAAELKRTIEYFNYSGSAESSAGSILWDIARNCISRLGLEDCVIYLLDEKRNVLVQKAAYGAKSPKAFEISNPIEIPVGKGITGEVAKTRKAMIVNDTSKDDRYIIDDEKRLSELTVPIIHDGKLIGVIDSENRKKNFFTAHHLKTMETISSLCASKIATAVALEAAKKAESELISLNGKMMESKFINLRLQMNPHFLFNILTTIQYLIVSNQVNKATNYLDIFAGFLRSLLNYAEENVVSLDEELRILNMYVELESLCLDETFVWDVNVEEDIDREEVLVPFMLLQPFVENAINHGLIHKIGEKRFCITIKDHDEDSLICIIEDNGVGRSASEAIKRKNLSNVLHQSKGIGIVEKRLELLQQKTSKRACFEIEDLYKNGEPSGTRVRIIIPYYSTEEI